MAARELIKRLNREFARELKKITFDRTGKIPERQKMLPDVPVPVVGASVPEKKLIRLYLSLLWCRKLFLLLWFQLSPPNQRIKKAIRVEWLDGVFVEFDKLATLGDKSRIHLKIVNTNADDCEVDLYSGNLTVINEKVKNLRLSVSNWVLSSMTAESLRSLCLICLRRWLLR